MLKKLWAAIVVATVFMLALSANALASPGVNLHRFFPEGIPARDTFAALDAVNSRAIADPSYGMAIARQAGESRYVAGNYRPVGFTNRTPAGTSNSATTSNGDVVRVKDRKGDTFRMLVILNVKTQKTVFIMIRCGNPRLGQKTGYPQVPWKPFKAEAVLRVNKQVTRTRTITCPSGQKVTGTLTVRVTGIVRARSWGQVKGSLKNWVQAQADLKVVAQLQLKCGPAPTPPPAPRPPAPTPPTAVVSASVSASASASASVKCPDGTTAAASASASASASATAATYQEAYNRALAQATAQANASAAASATASASASCGTPPPPPPPPPVVQHFCTISALAQKSDPYTAYVSLNTDAMPISSTFSWGDGTSAGGVISGIHTYPTPTPGPAGTGVTYTISVTAKFADGQSVSCGSAQFFVPAPPLSGNTAPPPPPAG